ncbi:ABC transporter permease [Streptomyces sp. KR80]|uniref:ABC transporter permease n=1 Tax=Streptomyces sp. KR80 TaxID=3457426 RepID=UPI003FD52071
MEEAPSALAARYGLSVSGTRPALPEYLRQLWGRRHFIATFAQAKLRAQYSQAKLGRLWQVVTPLLNAAVYYVIFGQLMRTREGVDDFVPFLVTGVFVFTFTQNSVLAGTRAVAGHPGLVRAVHFPRASLPIGFCLMQMQQMLCSLAVLVAIVLVSGEIPHWTWLLAAPTLLLQFVFNTGLAMVLARLGSRVPDLAQLMPFVLRTWMYASGVMYSIGHLAEHNRVPGFVRFLLEANPAAVYIDLMRCALIDSFRASGQSTPYAWAVAAGWALVIGVGGFVYFWKAEETYGRG